MTNSTKRKLITLMAVHNWVAENDEKILSKTEIEAIKNLQAIEFAGVSLEEFAMLSEDEQEKVNKEFAANLSDVSNAIISELVVELLAEKA
ncbi:hypothetical protein [Bacillus sp. NPDC077027]|uniref:hypothetical protein n=1 Tax=Bacillus sp. NPDC077027 TaxID=3390548 RepID=UPI003D04AA7C